MMACCRDRRARRAATLVILGSLLAGGAALSAGGALVAPADADVQTVTASNWTVYHGEPSGAGIATSPTPLSPLKPAWLSPLLDGQLYGEPLVFQNRIFVGTENDSVYALSAHNGSILWTRHLAKPVPSSQLPCGDISPQIGITGTPVIDSSRSEIFVAAASLVNGIPRHVLYGLNTSNGQVELQKPVDPPGSDPVAQLQRTGLNLDQGQVVLGYGGNAGDCSDYHGWVVAAPENGGALRTFEVDAQSGGRQGAVWMGGAAPEVDSAGHIWFATGNGSVTNSSMPYDNSDGVIQLLPTLQREQFFAPSTWAQDNAGDRDLGSSSPALLSGGLVVQAGKAGIAYLLRASDLGGIGGQLLANHICNNVVDGGASVSGKIAYLPCAEGTIALRATGSPPALKLRWQSNAGQGGVVIDGGLLYNVSSDQLVVLNGSNGNAVQQFPLGTVANHFPVPAVADGLVLAASARKVHAFDGPNGRPPGP